MSGKTFKTKTGKGSNAKKYKEVTEIRSVSSPIQEKEPVSPSSIDDLTAADAGRLGLEQQLVQADNLLLEGFISEDDYMKMKELIRMMMKKLE